MRWVHDRGGGGSRQPCGPGGSLPEARAALPGLETSRRPKVGAVSQGKSPEREAAGRCGGCSRRAVIPVKLLPEQQPLASACERPGRAAHVCPAAHATRASGLVPSVSLGRSGGGAWSLAAGPEQWRTSGVVGCAGGRKAAQALHRGDLSRPRNLRSGEGRSG